MFAIVTLTGFLCLLIVIVADFFFTEKSHFQQIICQFSFSQSFPFSISHFYSLSLSLSLSYVCCARHKHQGCLQERHPNAGRHLFNEKFILTAQGREAWRVPSVFQQSSFPSVILLKDLEALGSCTSHAHII